MCDIYLPDPQHKLHGRANTIKEQAQTEQLSKEDTVISSTYMLVYDVDSWQR